MDAARMCIKKKELRDTETTHPWLNDRCRSAIAAKHAHENSDDYNLFRDRCLNVGLGFALEDLSTC